MAQERPKRAPRGPPEGPKNGPRGPKRAQDSPKTAPRRILKRSYLELVASNSLLIRIQKPTSAKMPPRGAQERSKRLQEAPKRPPRGSQEAPRGPQETPNRPPRGSSEAPKAPQKLTRVPAPPLLDGRGWRQGAKRFRYYCILL